MLSRVQLDGFRQQGVLRLREAFPPSASQVMREVLWDALARRHGVLENDRATWDLPIATGLQRLRTHAAFEPITGPVLRSALDELIGAGRWQHPRHAGSLLVSFPQVPGTKSRPNFHTDFPYDLGTDRVDGALVFAFLDAVPARAGGTLVIEGSHRLVRSFIDTRPHLKRAKMKVARSALLASCPFLRALRGDWTEGDWVGGLPADAAGCGSDLRVIELTGQPGDVVVCHPWLLHSPSPNRGTGPRFMAVQRIRTSQRTCGP